MTSPPAGDRLWAWGSSFAAKDEPASPVYSFAGPEFA